VVVANERDSRVLIRTQEPKPRDVDVSPRDFDGLRLAYAQHVYKAQGLTSDRSLVLTGGWQTDREAVYVAVTRAREQTNIYTSREDLGHQGLDTDAINRLAHRASRSNAQQATISRQHAEPDREPSRAVRELPEALGRDAPRERERREGVEPEGEPSRAVRELREAMRQHEPRERECDDAPAPDSFAERLREAMGQDSRRDHEREDAPAPGSFAEQLRRIEQEQRDRDRDRGEGLEL
jgi:ATP-dependent exoDNAse (exonuclease V) beta subunit